MPILLRKQFGEIRFDSIYPKSSQTDNDIACLCVSVGGGGVGRMRIAYDQN